MHDGWEDCPGREQRQWLGDATVEFLVGQAGFGSTVNALNRQFLLHAAESQRPDGTEGVVRVTQGTIINR